MLLERLAGQVEVERAVEIISSGAEPLRELIGAMHSKLLLAALQRHRVTGRLTAGLRRVTTNVVLLHHPVALGQRHAARQLARERAERLAVGAADRAAGSRRSRGSASAVKRSSSTRDRSAANTLGGDLARLAVDPHRALAAATAGR